MAEKQKATIRIESDGVHTRVYIGNQELLGLTKIQFKHSLDYASVVNLSASVAALKLIPQNADENKEDK